MSLSCGDSGDSRGGNSESVDVVVCIVQLSGVFLSLEEVFSLGYISLLLLIFVVAS